MSLVVWWVLPVVIAGLWVLAWDGWVGSRDLWNGGVCAWTGHSWAVIEVDDSLLLDDCHGCRVWVRGIVIHPVITDALKRQKSVGRV